MKRKNKVGNFSSSTVLTENGCVTLRWYRGNSVSANLMLFIKPSVHDRYITAVDPYIINLNRPANRRLDEVLYMETVLLLKCPNAPVYTAVSYAQYED